MKTLFIAVNSQYVHLNLAIRSLNASVSHQAEILEFNINQEMTKIFSDIVVKNPKLVIFSTYIWNVEMVLKLCQDIKKAMPETIVALGGPEVSFTAEEIIKNNSYIDYILIGECEEIIPKFIQRVENNQDMAGLTGIVGKNYVDTTYNIVADINNLKPASEIYDNIVENKLYYYETSRGCPFSCAYCLSGSIKDNTRYLDLERVFTDLKYFSDNKVPIVKFVDRTFNADKKRAKEIIKFASKNTGNTLFHFEIGADILDDEIIELLNNSPEGKFQLEAGVQSCNEKTLEIVVRKTNLEKLYNNTTKIIEANNVHLHLDLIAGLPFENYESFGRSVNILYELNPHHLQLGFLKLLKGSNLLLKADEYGIEYRNYPPYEVIKTNELSALELIKLKDIEEIIERYYNTNIGRKSMNILKTKFTNPFSMLEEISQNFSQKGYLAAPMGIQKRLDVLCEYAKKYLVNDEKLWNEFLMSILYDIIRNKVKGNFPQSLNEIIEGIDNKPYRNKLLEQGKISGEEFKKAKFIPVKTYNQNIIIMALNGQTRQFLKEDLWEI